jgi:hypothetical protein
MDRTATAVLVRVFEIVAVIAVILMIASTADAYAKSETVTKINVAEDIKMMVNVLAGIPGDALVEYPRPVDKYSFILRSDRISVFQRDEPESQWIVRTFVLPDGYGAEGTIQEHGRICLEKKNTKVLLRECP